MRQTGYRPIASIVLGALLVGVTATNAGAQIPVPGGTGVSGMGSPALFGGARRQQPGGNNVSILASVFGGYDTNILAIDQGTGSGSGPIGSGEQTDSSFAGTAVSLQWNKQRPRVSYFGTAGGQYRAAFDVEGFNQPSYYVSAGMAAGLTRRSSVSLGGYVNGQPFYQFGVLSPFGGGLETPGTGQVFTPDYQAANALVLRYGTQGRYSYRLGPRTTFVADAGRNGFLPVNDAADESLTNAGSTYAGARIIRQLTTNLGVRLGYGYSQFDQVDTLPLLPGEEIQEQRVGVHHIDVGLDYSRGLTLARRTTFSFGTGTNISRSNDPRLGSQSGTHFNVNGFATLRRDFLRTWTAYVNYTRGTSYLEGFNDFGAFDTATSGITGLFTDRLDAGAGVTYSNGRVGTFVRERVSNLGAGAQLRYAFTSNLASYLSYTYTHFKLPEQLQPIVDAGSYSPDRQGVRFGLTVWLDLLR